MKIVVKIFNCNYETYKNYGMFKNNETIIIKIVGNKQSLIKYIFKIK